MTARARDEAVNGIPQDLLDFVRRCQESPRFFFETCLNVPPLRGGELVPFQLNPGQDLVMQSIERQLAENLPIRTIVLKSRRQGISTFGEGLVYWRTSCFPLQNGMVVAHQKDAASEIFRIAKLFWDADERQRLGVRPEILNSNETALRFDVDRRAKEKGQKGLRSSMLVETAEGSGVGRGLTLHALHASEAGFWVNPRLMAGLGIALSNTPGSVALVESTAEGEGGIFHKMWMRAIAKENEYDPVFLPWTLDPNCWIVVSDREREGWEFENAYERDLHEKHGLALEQIKFRRARINSPDLIRPGVKPEDLFRQEYPMTWEEAFLTSGSRFFLLSGVKALEDSGKGVKPPLYTATVPLDSVPANRKDLSPIIVIPQKAPFGELSVWEEPLPGEDYVIGADSAQGLEHGDNSVAWVLRRSNLKFVARLKTKRIDADEFGQKLCLLGWWYNSALIGPETNGPGVATVAAVRRLRYMRVWFDRDIVRPGEPIHRYIGWRTTQANRRTILERLEEEIRRGTIDMPAQDFYDECRSFILVDTGSGTARPEAMTGTHDDEILSVAITLQLHLLGGAMRNRDRAIASEVKPKFDPAHPKPNLPVRRSVKVLEWF